MCVYIYIEREREIQLYVYIYYIIYMYIYNYIYTLYTYIYMYGFGPVSGVIFYEVFYTWWFALKSRVSQTVFLCVALRSIVGGDIWNTAGAAWRLCTWKRLFSSEGFVCVENVGGSCGLWGGGWGLLGLVGVCGWFAISTRSPQPPPPLGCNPWGNGALQEHMTIFWLDTLVGQASAI